MTRPERSSLRRRSSAAPSAEATDAEPREFTLRAVVCGLVLGVLLCFTNMYFGEAASNSRRAPLDSSVPLELAAGWQSELGGLTVSSCYRPTDGLDLNDVASGALRLL